MDWITDHIAIGNFLEAQDTDLLQKHSIRSILGLIRTLQSSDATRLGLQRIEVVPLQDGPGNEPRTFLRAIELLEELVVQASPVLVHCHAGRSRSVVVVAGYLMKSMRIDADEALKMVTVKRESYVIPEMARLLDWV